MTSYADARSRRSLALVAHTLAIARRPLITPEVRALTSSVFGEWRGIDNIRNQLRALHDAGHAIRAHAPGRGVTWQYWLSPAGRNNLSTYTAHLTDADQVRFLAEMRKKPRD